MSEFGNVAVLYGGTSAEREISLKSGRAVHNALVEQGITAGLVDTREVSPLQLKSLGYDRVFNTLHGRGGEDGVIQGVLEYLKLPYAGSRVLGSALCMDKILTKRVWQSLALPTAKFREVKTSQAGNIDFEQMLVELNGKAFVKPAQEGSSIGMSMVTTADELKAAVNKALEFGCNVLIEQFINGPEFTVSILNGDALPSIRMQTPHAFYDYEAKYLSNSTEYFCPSGLSIEDETYIQSLAVTAFAAVDAEGWGRVDLMRDEDGQFYLLEVNTVPGMTEKSLVPMAAKAKGLSFAELVVTILRSAR
ncbi:D-alanine--D-alanine ligase [Algibacillus agarilyticus]|uniref:D-alanine--D-alanine ligase n=1 Tax=Algibacillus agarilyticus TaxID=2234133 RepID=UPI000DD030E4|nr:D-alanine--D-alanine ligase [Algibacillus agarilyticus]